MPNDDHIRLDELQWKAAGAKVGPIVIEGGPGSGKTTALMTRALLLMQNKVPERSILFLTPGDDRQAETLKTAVLRDLPRLTQAMPPERTALLHHYSYRTLAISWVRRFGPEVLGIPKDMAVWNRTQARVTTYRLAENSNLDRNPASYELRDVMRWNRFRRSRLTENIVPDVPSHWHEFVQHYHYEEVKRRQGVLDQDDVIPKALEVMQEGPELLERWRDRVRPHILADNFHILTPVEYRLLQIVAGRNGSVVAAGDRNQSIGSWGVSTTA